MMIYQSERIVGRVLAELASCKGFDEWWYEIDSKIQQEIKETLYQIVDKELG